MQGSPPIPRLQRLAMRIAELVVRRRRWPWAIAGLAIVLSLPSLTIGWLADDYAERWIAMHDQPIQRLKIGGCEKIERRGVRAAIELGGRQRSRTGVGGAARQCGCLVRRRLGCAQRAGWLLFVDHFPSRGFDSRERAARS